jgi:NAD(P)-dependent dehydrogenase (short-subunit alcohol dehydrogenase family)
LASQVRRFAEWVRAQGEPLDVLLNNAGANFMGVEPWYTQQGIAGVPQVGARARPWRCWARPT